MNKGYKGLKFIKQIGVLSTLFTGITLCISAAAGAEDPLATFRANKVILAQSAVTVAPDGALSLSLNIILPSGYHLNKEAPNDFVVRNDKTVFAKAKITGDKTVVNATPALCDGSKFTAESSIFYCGDIDKICRIKSFAFETPCSVKPGGTNEVAFTADVSG